MSNYDLIKRLEDLSNNDKKQAEIAHKNSDFANAIKFASSSATYLRVINIILETKPATNEKN